MATQSFVYNSNAISGIPNVAPIFNVNRPTLLRAAGLQTCVPIYMMVGDCIECHPRDVLWAPLMCCGKPVELCPDANQVLIGTPGKYSVGNPTTAPLVLAGDVNITKEEGVDASLVGKECACASAGPTGDPDDPLFTKILSTCLEPVFVKVCEDPPVPFTATGIACDGTPVVATGLNVIQTVPNPSAVQLVKICPVDEFVNTILCEPAPGTGKVLVVTKLSATGIPTSLAYNIDSTPYVGDINLLIACPGINLSSDPVDWCAAGVNVIQWVVKDDGEPTGDVYWTNAQTGAPIPAPIGATRGVCATNTCADAIYVKSADDKVEQFNVQVMSFTPAPVIPIDPSAFVGWAYNANGGVGPWALYQGPLGFPQVVGPLGFTRFYMAIYRQCPGNITLTIGGDNYDQTMGNVPAAEGKFYVDGVLIGTTTADGNPTTFVIPAPTGGVFNQLFWEHGEIQGAGTVKPSFTFNSEECEAGLKCANLSKITDCEGVVRWEFEDGTPYIPVNTPLRGSCGPDALEGCVNVVAQALIGCANGVSWRHGIMAQFDCEGNFLGQGESWSTADGTIVNQETVPVGFTYGPCPEICTPKAPVGVIGTWG